MNTNLFIDYYNYKIKTVYEYSILLTKIIGVDKNKLWHRRKDLETSLNWMIKDYFKNSFNNADKSSIVRCFINDKDISKYKITNELYSAINYFIKEKRGLEIPAYEKEIVLAASIIYIANKLDISTSPYKDNKNNYKTILMSLIEKFNKIEYFTLIDDGKNVTNKLLDFVKDNVKKERKIFELLNSKSSFNRYVDLSKVRNKYYLTQYNYSVPGIKSVDNLAAEFVYKEANIDDKFVLISKDLILVTLMKLFSIRKVRKIFFLPIKSNFFETESNVKELGLIYKNDILPKYIKILLNYSEFNDSIKNLLNKYNISYYVYCSKSTIIRDDVNEDAYLLSKDFNELHPEFNEMLLNENKKVIIEDFEKIVIDNELINESEEI